MPEKEQAQNVGDEPILSPEEKSDHASELDTLEKLIETQREVLHEATRSARTPQEESQKKLKEFSEVMDKPKTPEEFEKLEREHKGADTVASLAPKEEAPAMETEEERQQKLAEQRKILESIEEEGKEGEREKKKLKMPERKNLAETLKEIEDKEERKEKLGRILKSFTKGERVYRGKGEKIEYLKLIGIGNKSAEEFLKSGGRLNKNSELKFIKYDKNGQELGEISQKFGEIKYREWKKIKDNEAPKNGDAYVTNDGDVVALKVEKNERNNAYLLKNTDNEKDKGATLFADQIRRYEDEEKNVAYKRPIKPRSQAAEEFKNRTEKTETKAEEPIIGLTEAEVKKKKSGSSEKEISGSGNINNWERDSKGVYHLKTKKKWWQLWK